MPSVCWFFVVLALSVVVPGRVELQATTDYSSCCDMADRQLEKMENEIERLQKSLANDRQRIKALQKEIETRDCVTRQTNVMCTTVRNYRPKSVNLIKTLYPSSYARVYGIAKGAGEIYVLGRDSKTIRVFEDGNDFRQLREVQLTDIAIPFDMIYNNKSRCLYIADYENKCVWKLTTTTANAQPTRWLQNINSPCTMSVSRDGHVLMLRSGQPTSQLELYDLDASLIRRFELPEEIAAPSHAIQMASGNFIIGHMERRQTGGPEPKAVISQLTSEGQMVNRFYPSEELHEMSDLLYFASSVNEDLLFVADVWKHRVIVFDSTQLSWMQVLTTSGESTSDRPFRLEYDERKRHLLVGHWAARQIDRQWRDGRVEVYELI